MFGKSERLNKTIEVLLETAENLMKFVRFSVVSAPSVLGRYIWCKNSVGILHYDNSEN